MQGLISLGLPLFPLHPRSSPSAPPITWAARTSFQEILFVLKLASQFLLHILKGPEPIQWLKRTQRKTTSLWGLTLSSTYCVTYWVGQKVHSGSSCYRKPKRTFWPTQWYQSWTTVNLAHSSLNHRWFKPVLVRVHWRKDRIVRCRNCRGGMKNSTGKDMGAGEQGLIWEAERAPLEQV